MGGRPGGWSFLDAMWRWASFTTDASWTQAAGRVAIERLQADRLSRLLGWTRRHSAFYGEKWKGRRGANPRLTDLPHVHKAELMARFDDWVTDPAVTLKGVRELRRGPEAHRPSRSSASTRSSPAPAPRAFRASSSTTRTRSRSTTRWAPRAWARSPRRGTGTSPSPGTGTPSSPRRRATSRAWSGGSGCAPCIPWFEANARVFPVTAPIREICAELDRFQPTVVASYATVLRALACEKDAGRLALEPAVLWYGGEWLAPMARDHIERAFGCRVAGDYGASEFLNIAFECERGALHVNDDWVVLEPVDENYRPVPPDTPSASVLLTNLANRVQPLVRYELGDSVTRVSRPCGCGRPFPVIRVDGRRDEILRLHDAQGPRGAGAAHGAVHGGGGGRGGAPLPGRADRGRGRFACAWSRRRRSRDAPARVKEALAGFLARQGLAGISMRRGSRRDRRPPRERQVPAGVARDSRATPPRQARGYLVQTARTRFSSDS